MSNLRTLSAAGAASLFLMHGAALAGPVGGAVHPGTGIANIIPLGGGQWLIQASNGVVINYTSFNLLNTESVFFQQPSSTAHVLNRITNGMPTSLDGTISGNGIVFFANPAGVVFGPNSIVNAAGFYAAAANVDPMTFHNMATSGGPYQFQFDASAGGSVVVNPGANLIGGAAGVHLIGQQVANHGLIRATNGGNVTMTAHNGVVTIGEFGGNFAVRINATGIDPGFQGVTNTGQLETVGGGGIMLGAGDLYSLAIRLEGNGIQGGHVHFGGSGLANETNTNGAVVLGADTTINGDSMIFWSTVDGAHNLNLVGNTAFHGQVGGTDALASVSVTGDTEITGGL
ncbi:MAG TPA: filamentous hemagglutinin N-terminal domain-containing protein, partial [Phycisphaerales bacterium]|nr:filamentous hemagglutinin N-terminal domain-containing protein [Phycisphaerales bacterium]